MIALTLARAEFTTEGHTFVVTPIGEFGVHTGRPRYRVRCATCGVVVHEATTGVEQNVELHLRARLCPRPCGAAVCGLDGGCIRRRAR